LDNIESFKSLIHGVEIIDNFNYRINLSLILDNSIDVSLLSSSVSLKIGNLYKDISYSVYI